MHFTEYAEGPFLGLRPHRENHVEVLQNFIDGDVDICVNPADPDCPFMLASQPGTAIVNCHGSLSVIDGGAVSFGASSIEPAPTRPMIANSCAREKKQFHSHEAIFILADVQIREKLISRLFLTGLLAAIERTSTAARP